jgi:hypothetical protein
VLSAGCSSGPQQGNPSPDDGGLDGGGGPVADAADAYVYRSYAPTYDAVWNEVLHFNCATEFCHGGGTADYLELTSEAVGYSSLVDAMASGPMCAATGLKRVDPFHPETSLMYLKITTPPCGRRMPIGYTGLPLGQQDIDQIRGWIACGAPEGDAGCAADAGTE